MAMIVPPQVGPDGAYRPASLLRFVDEALQAGMTNHDMAKALSVPIHRVVYLLGDGRKVIEKRCRSA